MLAPAWATCPGGERSTVDLRVGAGRPGADFRESVASIGAAEVTTSSSSSAFRATGGGRRVSTTSSWPAPSTTRNETSARAVVGSAEASSAQGSRMGPRGVDLPGAAAAGRAEECAAAEGDGCGCAAGGGGACVSGGAIGASAATGAGAIAGADGAASGLLSFAIPCGSGASGLFVSSGGMGAGMTDAFFASDEGAGVIRSIPSRGGCVEPPAAVLGGAEGIRGGAIEAARTPAVGSGLGAGGGTECVAAGGGGATFGACG